MDNNSFSPSLPVKYLYYQLYRPDIELYIEQPTLDLGVYVDGLFVSFLDEELDKSSNQFTYHPVPKIKTVIFLDALYQASKGMEPFLSIATRLFKLFVDDHQSKAADMDLDLELFDKIKTMYWATIQDKAPKELINEGFEIVVNEAAKICVEWMMGRLKC
ncbi:MAG TPA: hypothetical protein VFD65_02215 [Chitinophagales bacterium]|nr:hypothetical protein [Chitinophagales bacterium]